MSLGSRHERRERLRALLIILLAAAAALMTAGPLLASEAKLLKAPGPYDGPMAGKHVDASSN